MQAIIPLDDVKTLPFPIASQPPWPQKRGMLAGFPERVVEKRHANDSRWLLERAIPSLLPRPSLCPVSLSRLATTFSTYPNDEPHLPTLSPSALTAPNHHKVDDTKPCKFRKTKNFKDTSSAGNEFRCVRGFAIRVIGWWYLLCMQRGRVYNILFVTQLFVKKKNRTLPE